MDRVNIVRDGETRLIQVVEDGEVKLIRVIGDGQAQLIRVVSEGPQGPQGLPGVTTLNELEDVDVSLLSNRSTLVYDASSGKWVGSPDTTVDEILNGGNF